MLVLVKMVLALAKAVLELVLAGKGGTLGTVESQQQSGGEGVE